MLKFWKVIEWIISFCSPGFGAPDPPAPDPAIGQAAQTNAATSAEMAGVARDELAWNKGRYEEAKPYYQQIANAQIDQMNTSNQRGTDQWNQYQSLYAPLEAKLATDAANYDTPARREADAARAGADVSGSYDQAQGVIQRNMESAGVNPNDPKFAATMQAAGLARAKDTAGAMNTARRNTELQGMSLVQGAAQVGRNLPATSIAQDASSLNASNSAQANITGSTMARNAGIGSAVPWYGGAIQGNTAAGNLLLGQYNGQLNAYGTASKNAQGNMAGLGTAAGLAMSFMKDGGIARRKPVAYANGGISCAKGGIDAAARAAIDPSDGAVESDNSYAEGGMVEGPGDSTSDSIDAKLSDGEGVLNAEATELVGEEFINNMNQAGLAMRGARGGSQQPRMGA